MGRRINFIRALICRGTRRLIFRSEKHSRKNTRLIYCIERREPPRAAGQQFDVRRISLQRSARNLRGISLAISYYWEKRLILRPNPGSIFAFEDEIGDGQEGAAVFAVGHFARHSFARQTYSRASVAARVERARFVDESCDLFGANARKSRSSRTLATSRRLSPLAWLWPLPFPSPLFSAGARTLRCSSFERENQRQRDFSFLQIAEHRLAQRFRRRGEIEQDRRQVEMRGPRCGRIRRALLRHAWAAGQELLPGARIR